MFRSITHGTCTLNGLHSNPYYARECPLGRRNRGAAVLHRVPQVTPSEPPSNQGVVDIVSSTSRPVGRPRKHPDDKARKRAWKRRQS